MAKGQCITKANMQVIYNLYKSGTSKSEIGRLMGLSHSSIWAVIKVIETQIAGGDVDSLFGVGTQLAMKKYAKEMFPRKEATVKAAAVRESLSKICEGLKTVVDLLKELNDSLGD